MSLEHFGKTLRKVNFCIAIMARLGAQWLSGRVLDSRPKASPALGETGAKWSTWQNETARLFKR